MTKFKQGRRFRHDNSRDADILIVSVDSEMPSSVKVTVMYLAQANGRPLTTKDGAPFMARQQITIKQTDYDSWKQVVEEED